MFDSTYVPNYKQSLEGKKIIPKYKYYFNLLDTFIYLFQTYPY